MGNGYLDVLAELGIDIPEDTWNTVHDIRSPTPPGSPEYPTLLPSKPHHMDADTGLPVFTTSQLEWCAPEAYGYTQYEVVEDEAAAHPLALDYDQELYYRGNYIPTHRYDRLYRIRWVLGHLVGCLGKYPLDVEERLRRDMAAAGNHLMWSRKIYEWVRGRLRLWKLPHLYLSIPLLVSRLGGPRWRVSERQYRMVLEDAVRLHQLFNTLHREGKLKRQRFPSMLFVLLSLLDRHGVMPPYRIPWARTSIRRRGLHAFLQHLETCLDQQSTTATGSTDTSSPTKTATSSLTVTRRAATTTAPT